VAADLNNDSWPDIYAACDSMPSLLFRNNHDDTFREVGLQEGVALNDHGQEQAGMGLGIGDFNLDGSLDILKTHFPGDTPALYSNRGGWLSGRDAARRFRRRRDSSVSGRPSPIWTTTGRPISSG
jgi:hypothetical protein